MKIFYAQSGGVTSVINATLAALVQSARQNDCEVFIGLYGIKGLLKKQWVEARTLSDSDLEKIAMTPGGSFGSCRYRLSQEDSTLVCQRLTEEGFDAIIYQGGNDSQATLLQISEDLQRLNSRVRCIGLPKTIDNDLAENTFCPGFLSSAEFLIRGFRGACLDVQSMCQDSTKVFIIETMGRHTGWLAAACGLSHTASFKGPSMILIPEKHHSLEAIESRVMECVREDGFCAIAMSEGYLPQCSSKADSFGHKTLEGSGLFLKHHLEHKCHLKTRVSIPDYLQRSFFSLVNPLDKAVSLGLGQHAIDVLKSSDDSELMLTVFYDFEKGDWSIGRCRLSQVAHYERPVPAGFLDSAGWHLSEQGRHYFASLLEHGLNESRLLPSCETLWPHYLGRIPLSNR